MNKAISPDYQTSFLLPPNLEEWIPARHPARFIREFVETQDLKGLGFETGCATEGRPPYAAELLLKLWLYAYLNKLYSSRALERACHENVALIWLGGLSYPDHNTLWRFWSQNKKAVRELFLKTVKVACQLQLVDMVLNAVDGTKLAAVCSGRSGWSRQRVEQLLAELGPQIQRMEQQIQKAGSAEAPAYQLPAELADKKKLRQELIAVQEQMDQIGRKHVHPDEPEARRLKCEGANRFGYNAQAVADAKAGVIVAAQVYNQEQDKGLGPVMLQQAKDNVGAAPQKTLADAGYGAAEDLVAAQQAGFEMIAPGAQGSASAKKPYHASHFRYDESREVCVCPQGQELSLERQTTKADRGRVRIYRCHHPDCPVRSLCTRDRQGRMIELGQHHLFMQRHRQKLADPQVRQLLRRRQTIIEPIFALVKDKLRFRRWTVRGLAGVSAQWYWLCTTVNLLRLMKVWGQTG